MFALIEIGSVAFFVITVITFGMITTMVENTKPGWAFIMLVGFFAVLWAFGGFNILGLIWRDPIRALVVLLAYAAVGVAWSIVRWTLLVMKIKARYTEFKTNFKRDQSIKTGDQWTIQQQSNFDSLVYSREYDMRLDRPPEVGNFSDRVFTWMAYWPISMLWTAINDPIAKFFGLLFDSITGAYDTISKRLYRDIT
jgi:hypothetical protein